MSYLPSENKTYVNFRKADWQQFEHDTEQDFSALPPPTDVYKAEKIFRRIVNGAAKKNIPAGRIKSIIPEIPTATADLIKERDRTGGSASWGQPSTRETDSRK